MASSLFIAVKSSRSMSPPLGLVWLGGIAVQQKQDKLQRRCASLAHMPVGEALNPAHSSRYGRSRVSGLQHKGNDMLPGLCRGQYSSACFRLR